MDKTELIATIREAHQRVGRALEHVSDKRLLEPVTDDWTGKDLLTHMAWWHDNSARVITGLRAGREPYDRTDPANTTDAFNERVQREHLDDPPQLARRAFSESFTGLLSTLEPVTDDELFSVDRWPWLDGEALVEMILWDTQRHYDGHREQIEQLVP